MCGQICSKICDWRGSTRCINGAVRPCEENIGCTLDEDSNDVCSLVGDNLMESGHELVGTVERNFCDTRTIFTKVGDL